MSAFYDLYETADVQKTGEKQPLHPRLVARGTMTKEEFIDHVHRFSHLPRNVLSGCLEAFQDELAEALANGWKVELGDIGFFSISLKGKAVMNKKEVHAQSISLKNVTYRASTKFKRKVNQGLSLERQQSATRPPGKLCSDEECLALIDKHLEKYPCINRQNYSDLTGHHKKLALKELQQFVNQGELIRYGKGAGVVYARKK